MSTLSVASLHIHPIKSLGGFAVREARITDRGFEHDRRWMLVDGNNVFISQREEAAMACLHCAPQGGGFRVTDVRDGDAIDLPWTIEEGEALDVKVWDDVLIALRAPANVSSWFSTRLGTRATLVFMPDASHRAVDGRYAQGITSLSDGFPYLILSQASLDDLNARMPQPLPMERFRPNIVIASGEAFQEDAWNEVRIGSAHFSLVKACARCVIPNIDQRTGVQGKEPLRTLASFRRGKSPGAEEKVLFGMNAMAAAGSVVRVGDRVNT